MKEQRKLMEKALKDVVVKAMRGKGFTGSYPHLRRSRDELIDVISFQHFSWGGVFCVNVSSIDKVRLARIQSLGWPPEKVNAFCTPDISRRLLQKLPDGTITEDFEFGPSIGISQPNSEPLSYYQQIAESVLHLIEVQAEEWWATPELFIPSNYIGNPNINF